jgi:hypothetical protein
MAQFVEDLFGPWVDLLISYKRPTETSSPKYRFGGELAIAIDQ